MAILSRISNRCDDHGAPLWRRGAASCLWWELFLNLRLPGEAAPLYRGALSMQLYVESLQSKLTVFY